jgi:hypothetical protein
VEVCYKASRAQRMFFGHVVFSIMNLKAPYYSVKSHLLGQPYGLGPCKSVSVSKQREMEKEDSVGLEKVAAACKKTKMRILFHS